MAITFIDSTQLNTDLEELQAQISIIESRIANNDRLNRQLNASLDVWPKNLPLPSQTTPLLRSRHSEVLMEINCTDKTHNEVLDIAKSVDPAPLHSLNINYSRLDFSSIMKRTDDQVSDYHAVMDRFSRLNRAPDWNGELIGQLESLSKEVGGHDVQSGNAFVFLSVGGYTGYDDTYEAHLMMYGIIGGMKVGLRLLLAKDVAAELTKLGHPQDHASLSVSESLIKI